MDTVVDFFLENGGKILDEMGNQRVFVNKHLDLGRYDSRRSLNNIISVKQKLQRQRKSRFFFLHTKRPTVINPRYFVRVECPCSRI